MKLKNNYWLFIGAAAFITLSLYSIARSLIGVTSIYYMIEISIDWLAAMTIYFFLGAMIGHIIDWIRYKKNKHPLWVYMTIALWIISAITVAIIADIGILETIFFPFIYGIFFTGYAFTILTPKMLYTSTYGKLLYNIIILGIFSTWLYYTIKNKQKLLTKILLIILFIIFFAGFIGCATALK